MMETILSGALFLAGAWVILVLTFLFIATGMWAASRLLDRIF